MAEKTKSKYKSPKLTCINQQPNKKPWQRQAEINGQSYSQKVLPIWEATLVLLLGQDANHEVTPQLSLLLL